MTINNAANKVIALGNGVTTQFGFSFVGDQPGYISVIFTNSAGVNTTLTQGPGPTQYQLSLNPPVSPGLWGIGGTVTYNPGGTPIPSGTTLTIIRELPFLQDVSLLDLASLAAVSRAAESGLDQEEMQIQQLAENLARVVAGPVSDPAGINYILPPVAQRANTGLLFDSMGNIIAGTTPATGIISTAMQPVVDAASLAAGRLVFGLGSMALENVNGGTAGGTSIQDDGSAAGPNGVGYARVATATVEDGSSLPVDGTFHFNQRIATGPITYTLPLSSTLWNGFGFWISVLPGTGTVTLAPNASDNFSGLASGVPVSIGTNEQVFVTTNGTSPSGVWYIRGDTGQQTARDSPLNVRAFGAVGDGSTDDAPAVNAALAALPAEGGAIYFPPGKYNLATQIAYALSATIASVSILGAGQDASILYFPNASTGFVINYSQPSHSAHIRDLSVTTGTTNAGNGIALVQTVALGKWAISDITRVTVRGDDNVVTYYWTTGIFVWGVSGVNIDSVYVTGDSTGGHGNGISYLGLTATSPYYAVVLNVAKSNFNWLGTGIELQSYVQGVTIDQCNFVNGSVGIGIPPAQSGVLAQLVVSNSQFNTTADQIQLGTQVVDFFATHNLFIIPTGYSAIDLGTAVSATITGNQMSTLMLGTGNGVIGAASFVTLTGNIFNSLALEAWQQGTAGNFWTYSQNVFTGNSSGIGIQIDHGAAMISGNIFNGLATGVVVTTPASTPVNIQANFYSNNSTNTNPASSSGDVVVGGGSP